jgi:hypothetical protein
VCSSLVTGTQSPGRWHGNMMPLVQSTTANTYCLMASACGLAGLVLLLLSKPNTTCTVVSADDRQTMPACMLHTFTLGALRIWHTGKQLLDEHSNSRGGAAGPLSCNATHAHSNTCTAIGFLCDLLTCTRSNQVFNVNAKPSETVYSEHVRTSSVALTCKTCMYYR